MSKKSKIKREMEDIEREIEALEQKRERSQIAVMRAMISGTKASPEDEQYFMAFSALIDEEREHLRQLNAELQQIELESKQKKKPKKGKDDNETEEPKAHEEKKLKKKDKK